MSKKELKKKELEDMDAVFAELGINVEARCRKGSLPPRLRAARRVGGAAASICAAFVCCPIFKHF